MSSCRMMLGLLLATTLCLVTPPGETAGHAAAAKEKKKAGKATLYVRYEDDGDVSYGILEGKKIRRIDGDLFGKWKRTNKTVDLDDVKLLVPSRPTQVFAMAGNYKSHLGDLVPPKAPEPFLKTTSSVVGPAGKSSSTTSSNLVTSS